MRIDMTAPRAQTSRLALLASAALVSLSSAAQPVPAPAPPTDRELSISGAPGERPAELYGAPDRPLLVIFDAPVKNDAELEVQGAEVRRHPFVQNAIVITPSKSLAAAQSPVPVLVPLADGVVDLTLAFSPDRRDASVHIVRRASSSAFTDPERRELLTLAAREVLGSGTCANADAPAVPRQVTPGNLGRGPLLPIVCAGGAFAYLRVKAPPDCAPATARLTRGEESAEVLLLEAQTTGPCLGSCWLLVARTPPGDGRGFALDLLTEDGVPCKRFSVDLKPNSQ